MVRIDLVFLSFFASVFPLFGLWCKYTLFIFYCLTPYTIKHDDILYALIKCIKRNHTALKFCAQEFEHNTSLIYRKSAKRNSFVDKYITQSKILQSLRMISHLLKTDCFVYYMIMKTHCYDYSDDGTIRIGDKLNFFCISHQTVYRILSSLILCMFVLYVALSYM